jgi:hypothetical protein
MIFNFFFRAIAKAPRLEFILSEAERLYLFKNVIATRYEEAISQFLVLYKIFITFPL